MNKKLVLFLALFPFSLWGIEMFLRWLLNDAETVSFLAPAISGAALGMIGPVALPRHTLADQQAIARDRNASFAGLIALIFGYFGWIFCLGLSIKKDIPAGLGGTLSKEDWQFAVSMLMYVAGVVLTMWKEPDQ